MATARKSGSTSASTAQPARKTVRRRPAAKRGRGFGAAFVYEGLREDILSLRLRPGTLLDETELAGRFKVSRSPVREALIRLSGEGLVQTLRNRSSIVAPFDVTTIHSHLNAMYLMYGLTARLAALNRSQTQLEGLRAMLDAHRAAMARDDSAKLIANNRDFHVAIAEAGASELVIHARTKAHGYKPPAYWERIAEVRSVLPAHLKVVANGEVWTPEQAQRCREVTGCDTLMIGRGQVTDPGLALAIKGQAGGVPWADLLPLLHLFWLRVCSRVDRRHRAGRLKQWLNYLRRRHPGAQQAFDELRLSNEPAFIEAWLDRRAACRNAATVLTSAPLMPTPDPV